MAHKIVYAIIIGGFVLIFLSGTFPAFHSIIGGMDTTGMLPINAAWVKFQPYLYAGVLLYAVYYFTHRRGG